jgi:catechol 2,3-dioxygenase-like lactoylglutathione lyase family enzyme
MKQWLANITLVVDDYDRAIQFYTEILNFQLIEDTLMSETKRWVVICPPGSQSCGLLLAKAANEEQRSRIGNQTGGRVFLFLHTDNFDRDHNNLISKGVKIVNPPRNEPYGKVCVFADLYGNLIDLIEPKNPKSKKSKIKKPKSRNQNPNPNPKSKILNQNLKS